MTRPEPFGATPSVGTSAPREGAQFPIESVPTRAWSATFAAIRTADHEYVDIEDYLQQFTRAYEGRITSLDKLERGQTFAEPGFASWEAFAAGDWEKSLKLVDDAREGYARHHARATERGITRRRLRVVELPVSAYVQWSMHVLRLRHLVGDRIKVIDAAALHEVEREAPVPEAIILGSSLMFEVHYEHGLAVGAKRYVDPHVIAETAAGFTALYDLGERFTTFFEREIRDLPPPRPGPCEVTPSPT